MDGLQRGTHRHRSDTLPSSDYLQIVYVSSRQLPDRRKDLTRLNSEDEEGKECKEALVCKEFPHGGLSRAPQSAIGGHRHPARLVRGQR
jgi:hypothetical protein